jgi:formylmethanofuran dehydrogenase subunit E
MSTVIEWEIERVWEWERESVWEWQRESVRVTFEHRDENKSCSACQEWFNEIERVWDWERVREWEIEIVRERESENESK